MFHAFHLLPLVAISDFFSYAQLNLNSEFPRAKQRCFGQFARLHGESCFGKQLQGQASEKIEAPSRAGPLPACLELKGDAIEVQEFLQSSVVREFQRGVGESHASEDTWSFMRYLNDEDLEKYAEIKVLLVPVEFTAGKVAARLRTQELNEGYVRVQISTHFQRQWETADSL